MTRFANRYAAQRMLIVGLGASGASALRYLVREGADVVVTDSRAKPPGIDALRTQFPQVQFCLGAFSAPSSLAQFHEAIISPGVSLDEPFVCQLADEGVSLIGDVELFVRAVQELSKGDSKCGSAKPAIVAITGSNGKSTVTTLVGDMARAAGRKVAVGGNLGATALDLLSDDVDLYVLELSSFQLETTHSMRCTAAAYLNLSEDHLDRHGDMANYGRIKSRIYAFAGTAVFNRDDGATQQGIDRASTRISFGLHADAAAYCLRHIGDEVWLCKGDEGVCPRSVLKLPGQHNLVNALAALALAEAVGIDREACVQALSAFTGLPHRCEFVAQRKGVTWLNDSKGTNVGSSLAALNGLDGQIVWLGGGQGKGQDFRPLRAPLARKGRAALLFGEDASAIEHALLGAVPIFRRQNMLEALSTAQTLAREGDTVLLSPACASLDQFSNYIERGETFRAWVEAQA